MLFIYKVYKTIENVIAYDIVNYIQFCHVSNINLLVKLNSIVDKYDSQDPLPMLCYQLVPEVYNIFKSSSTCPGKNVYNT